jgi:hypothetical protein
MPITIEQKKDILELAGYEFRFSDDSLYCMVKSPNSVLFTPPLRSGVKAAWDHYNANN